ncbi:hypothetical protein GOP47_0019753, partial [Adiantum capillus-veneris]
MAAACSGLFASSSSSGISGCSGFSLSLLRILLINKLVLTQLLIWIGCTDV